MQKQRVLPVPDDATISYRNSLQSCCEKISSTAATNTDDSSNLKTLLTMRLRCVQRKSVFLQSGLIAKLKARRLEDHKYGGSG